MTSPMVLPPINKTYTYRISKIGNRPADPGPAEALVLPTKILEQASADACDSFAWCANRR
ncbi:TPA: hypothetical protein SMP48_000417 [Proteus mirabilis]|nr:hypothetical protein [Proteus mirabilis]